MRGPCQCEVTPQPQGPRSLAEARRLLRPLQEKYFTRRLEVFGSVAKGVASAESDLDLLVTLDGSKPLGSRSAQL